MGDKDKKNFLNRAIKNVKDNPVLISPIIIWLLSLEPIINDFLKNSLSVVTIGISGFIIAIGFIIYQSLSCNIKIKNITSNFEHEKKLKNMLASKSIDGKEFEERMALLRKY